MVIIYGVKNGLKMKKHKIILDDFRDNFDVYWILRDPIFFDEDWIIVKNVDELIKVVVEIQNKNEEIEIISFDNDLVDEHYSFLLNESFFNPTTLEVLFEQTKQRTGFEGLIWFVEYYKFNNIELPKILIHTQNFNARKVMKKFLKENERSN